MSLRNIQQELKNMNHDPGPIDGLWGQRTKTALQSIIDHEGNPIVVDTGEYLDLPWLVEGKKVFGLHETRDNAELKRWLRSDGKTLGDPKALPWCGDFTETVIKNSLPNEPFDGSLGENPYWARNWLEFGKACPVVYGCVVVFGRGSGGHVGFAVGQDSNDYYVFGGNQGNTVSIVRIDKSRLLGSRWPSTYPYKNKPLPNKSPQDVFKSSNEI